jgi:hypothetical protein
MPSPSAARIGRLCGMFALLCAIGSLVGAFTSHFALFWLLGYAAALFGLGGVVFGTAGLIASRGERGSGAFGLVAGLVVLGLPILLVLALIAALSSME